MLVLLKWGSDGCEQGQSRYGSIQIHLCLSCEPKVGLPPLTVILMLLYFFIWRQAFMNLYFFRKPNTKVDKVNETKSESNPCPNKSFQTLMSPRQSCTAWTAIWLSVQKFCTGGKGFKRRAMAEENKMKFTTPCDAFLEMNPYPSLRFLLAELLLHKKALSKVGV